LNKWERGFNFYDKIEKEARVFLEKKVTHKFFDGKKKQTDKLDHNSKVKIVSALVNNIQQIFSSSSTMIERLRNPIKPSKYGYSFDIQEMLKQIYRDDIYQPKPQAKLSL
jgi:hypothetical protein